MSIRLDYFYVDGTHIACVYNEVTGNLLYADAVLTLREFHSVDVGQWPDCWRTTPLRTIVKCHVTESPWF